MPSYIGEDPILVIIGQGQRGQQVQISFTFNEKLSWNFITVIKASNLTHHQRTKHLKTKLNSTTLQYLN